MNSRIHDQPNTICIHQYGQLSSPRSVISGVPQGRVIGPLIFLILIGDIDENTLQSNVASFADDTRVTNGIRCEEDAVDLQGDLFHIYDWSVVNNMMFNDVKFELLRYGNNIELKESTSYVSPSFQLIEEKETVRDLGVTLSADATFKTHISNIVEAAKKVSSWILRTFKTREKTTMLTLYKSLVRPILEYSSVLWSPITKGEIQRIEAIQKSFLRKMHGVSRDYNQALSELNLYSLETRRTRYIAIQVWKMVEQKSPSMKPPFLLQTTTQDRRGRTLQTPNLAAIPSHLHKIKSQSVRCSGAKIFNSLPKHVRNTTNTTVEDFKHKIDLILTKTSDSPFWCSGGDNGSNNTNHSANAPSQQTNVEQDIAGFSNHNPQVQNDTLPRRPSVAPLMTL